MKTKVLKSFFDKNTGIGYKEGETFEGEDERIAELAQQGFVNAKKPEKAPEKEK